MVSEAARGINIVERYPVFHQRLLADPELQQRFQSSLDLLRRTRTNIRESLPGPPSRDLSFLPPRPRPTAAVTTDTKGWQATFQQTVAHLNALFFAPLPAMQTRQTWDLVLDEDNWFTLFRQRVIYTIDSWDVLLEGTPADDPENSLALAVMVTPTLNARLDTPGLQVALTWGCYQETVILGQTGRATFPLLALEAVLNETGSGVKDDLFLTLAVPTLSSV